MRRSGRSLCLLNCNKFLQDNPSLNNLGFHRCPRRQYRPQPLRLLEVRSTSQSNQLGARHNQTGLTGRVHIASTRSRETSTDDTNQPETIFTVTQEMLPNHQCQRVPLIIPDKDEVAGSNPAGPTNQTPCPARGFGFLPVNSIISRSRCVHIASTAAERHTLSRRSAAASSSPSKRCP